jgi:hypothetical protein
MATILRGLPSLLGWDASQATVAALALRVVRSVRNVCDCDAWR